MQIPMFLVGIAVSVTVGRHSGVLGKLLLGAVGQIAACALMLALTARSPLWTLVVLAVVFGVPQGSNSLALQNSVYFQADVSVLSDACADRDPDLHNTLVTNVFNRRGDVTTTSEWTDTLTTRA